MLSFCLSVCLSVAHYVTLWCLLYAACVLAGKAAMEEEEASVRALSMQQDEQSQISVKTAQVRVCVFFRGDEKTAHVCMYHVCMYACMYACTYVCMFACMCACMYVLVCMYECMYVCMYVYMHVRKMC